ncbi:MAG: sulfite exporter TauE/SafE family protein [Halobacteriales archaeon]
MGGWLAPATALPGAGRQVELAVFAAIGLLGSAHCLGMCGPLVTTYADRLSGRRNALSFREVRQHTLFNLGRTASYTLIGGLLGLLGGLLFDAAAVVALLGQVRGVTGIAVGVVIVAVGLGYALRGTSVLAPIEGSGAFARAYGLIGDRVDRWVQGPRIALLGGLHGLLPCPLLYPAFLYAFARGDPVAGASALFVLGLGTIPTLFLYGAAFGAASPTTRRRLHRALGVAFLLLGYVPLSMGLSSLGVDVPTAPIPVYQPLG